MVAVLFYSASVTHRTRCQFVLYVNFLKSTAGVKLEHLASQCRREDRAAHTLTRLVHLATHCPLAWSDNTCPGDFLLEEITKAEQSGESQPQDHTSFLELPETLKL